MDNDSSRKASSFWTQSDALLRKNLTYQKRNAATNCRLISFPSILCIILAITQGIVDKQLNKPSNNRCACSCVDNKGIGECQQVCDAHYSIRDQASTCGIPNPPEWPALLQIPEPEYRAVRNDISSSTDLPNESCRILGSCPVTVLVTGNNQTLGQILAGTMFTISANVNSSDLVSLADVVLGSTIGTAAENYFEVGFTEDNPLYNVRGQCESNSRLTVSIQQPGVDIHKEATCVQSLTLWRNSSTLVNDELYKGYQNGNTEKKINEILAAYDFLDSSGNKFNVIIWYNSTQDDDSASSSLIQVPRLVNLVTNAYLQVLHGSGTKILLEFVKKFPKHATYQPYFDVTSLLSTLFFTWVVLQLFPVVLTSLVYEKQQNLRIMMKMHGLGYGPYWLITYAYFLVVSLLYILVFVVFGALVGLKFFTLNDPTIQLVFYFIYINLQITFAFLAAAFFSNVKTATAVSYICVFGSGLIGEFVFKSFIEDTSFPRGWIIVLELYPAFTLYHGLYEFAQYASMGNTIRDKGMRWMNLKDKQNGMKIVLIVMFVEWLLVLFVAYYIDQVLSTGSRKSPQFLFRKRQPSALRNTNLQRQGSKVFVDMQKPDVSQEREKVEQLLLEPVTSHAIVCDNLGKVYPGRDGNPEKLAVRGLSLALPRGECFGLLGPNGAGKTSFISMMIGLTNPSTGTAYVEGMDIRTEMDWIYTSMGVCPQHDLLWESLTGREHLLFYGRLKNLKGSALKRAVEESLRSVNLLNGGAADKQAGKYSGGMKRRLSVAISLIGDPKVVYMDEPSTGLDPASRRSLWNAVKRAKQNRAIILTTHSMEEAEVLCDRIGIFVDGGLQCIGNPKELKARYGESYVFSMTTSLAHEAEVVNMVRGLSPNAIRTYHTSGTQKFEIPKHEVKIAQVFHAVEVAKSRFPVFAWGLSDTTLEDVFIKVATGA